MPERTTEPGVVEGYHLRKTLTGRRMTALSFGSVTEAGPFVGGWQFRPHWRGVMGNSLPKRLASMSLVSPNRLGRRRS